MPLLLLLFALAFDACTRSQNQTNPPSRVAEDTRKLKSMTAIAFVQTMVENTNSAPIVLTNAIDVMRFRSMIHLEEKPRCWCLHVVKAVCQTQAGQVEVSFCDHCFDVVSDQHKRYYKMPPHFYEEFIKVVVQRANADWDSFPIPVVMLTNTVGFSEFVPTTNLGLPSLVAPTSLPRTTIGAPSQAPNVSNAR